MIFRSVFVFALLFVAANATPAHAQTIVDIAAGDENFSSLVDAVVAQDLVDTLNSEGPFTVFAPTNEAFEALPGYIGNALAENPDLLTDILLYHVVPGELFAADVLASNKLTTAEGSKLTVNTDDDDAFVNRSEITALNIEAENGVVHVIDRVLIPRSVYNEAVTDLREEVRDLLKELREALKDRRMETRKF